METYDYIIVGAGSAGCALANRLSADPAIKVCLIEAGKKDNSLMVRMPAGVGSLIKQAGDYNWGFYTEAQKHMNGRKLYWPRGKAVLARCAFRKARCRARSIVLSFRLANRLATS